MESPLARLGSQWASPSDVSTVLMIIGGDVVRVALAQSTGSWFTPVCFSFGWVSYAFIALINIIGDGRLLPPPDYPVKVFNLVSGYARENKNWVLGRILRDHEASISRQFRCNEGIRISVYVAKRNPNAWTTFSMDPVHWLGALVVVCQLVIAAIPIAVSRDWTVMLITGVGTILAQTYGSLPQWTAEKLPNRQHAPAVFALTSGNGSKDILIIHGCRRSLDLEEFCVTDTPRNQRPWGKFTKSNKAPDLESKKSVRRRFRLGYFYAVELKGKPIGFWITVGASIAQLLAWIALLITVATTQANTWFLLSVGLLGMLQNGIIAAVERSPEARNLPLELHSTIVRPKVMDALMDLEVELNDPMSVPGSSCASAQPLRKEFFPGPLRENEEKWWEQGIREPYDTIRNQEQSRRGISRSWGVGAPSRAPSRSRSPSPLSAVSARKPNQLRSSDPGLGLSTEPQEKPPRPLMAGSQTPKLSMLTRVPKDHQLLEDL
ncbi:hypothetical protein F4780DRAFT_599832 [Xylariomycetidae sp. FL0641]|nr:hypothetical protein F4780DRAFT_599832 [Xylariomycetidae sp. FL0641]